MENYMQHNLTALVKRVRMKVDCLPSRFSSQKVRKKKKKSGTKSSYNLNKAKKGIKKTNENSITAPNYCTPEHNYCIPNYDGTSDTLSADESSFLTSLTSNELSSHITDDRDITCNTFCSESRDIYQCNECSHRISGFRYICVQCVDFSLCILCEMKGVHGEHYILRMPKLRPDYGEIKRILEEIRLRLFSKSNDSTYEDIDDDNDIKLEVKEEALLIEDDGVQPSSYDENPTSLSKNEAFRQWSPPATSISISKPDNTPMYDDSVKNVEISLNKFPQMFVMNQERNKLKSTKHNKGRDVSAGARAAGAGTGGAVGVVSTPVPNPGSVTYVIKAKGEDNLLVPQSQIRKTTRKRSHTARYTPSPPASPRAPVPVPVAVISASACRAARREHTKPPTTRKRIDEKDTYGAQMRAPCTHAERRQHDTRTSGQARLSPGAVRNAVRSGLRGSPKKSVNKEKLYCVCRTPYDNTKFYVGCERCYDWFHGDCVGITEAMSTTMEEYVCAACRRPGHLQELYCICRQPYDNSQFYICCDRCQDWFHGRCVGMLQSEADEIDEYICPNCLKKDPDDV